MSDNIPDSIVLPEDRHLHYDFASGRTTARFLHGLSQGRILGTSAGADGRVYVPPRAYCEQTFEPAETWTEVGPKGTIEASTVVALQIQGHPDPPFVIAFVRLDGAGTAMANYVELRPEDMQDLETARRKVAPGTRVEAKFIDQPIGRVTDFTYILADE